MPKLKLEKLTGLVALSYLVLIPAAGYAMYRKLSELDRDLTLVWEELKMPSQETTSRININRLKDAFRS